MFTTQDSDEPFWNGFCKRAGLVPPELLRGTGKILKKVTGGGRPLPIKPAVGGVVPHIKAPAPHNVPAAPVKAPAAPGATPHEPRTLNYAEINKVKVQPESETRTLRYDDINTGANKHQPSASLAPSPAAPKGASKAQENRMKVLKQQSAPLSSYLKEGVGNKTI